MVCIMNRKENIIKEKTTVVKYYELTPDEERMMKDFLEFEDLKRKLNTSKVRVVIPEEEEEFAKQFFLQNNYYDFSIYKKCLPQRDDNCFSFKECVELYYFNSFLRENLMKFTGKIELLIKSSIIHSLCSNYNGKLQVGECYLDSSLYRNQDYFIGLIERIGMSLYNSQRKSLPVAHHVNEKKCKFPFWVIVPELTFGETTKLIEQLDSKYYELWIEELFLSNSYYSVPALRDHIISTSKSWISATWFIRNVCAHYGRLYGCNFNIAVPSFYAPTLREIKKVKKLKTHNKDLFAYMLAIKQIIICHGENVHQEWNDFIEEIERKFDKSSILEVSKIGFPKEGDWKKILQI